MADKMKYPTTIDLLQITSFERARRIADGRLRERLIARFPDGFEIVVERDGETIFRAVPTSVTIDVPKGE